MIRNAKISDVHQIAKVRNDTWKTTYKGIISDNYLEHLNDESKAQSCARFLNESNKYILVHEFDANKLINGFIQFGTPNEDMEVDSEIYALYVLEEFQGQGIGKLLIKKAMELLKTNGMKTAILWVFQDNLNAKSFYEHIGGTRHKTKLIRIGDEEIISCSYLFHLV